MAVGGFGRWVTGGGVSSLRRSNSAGQWDTLGQATPGVDLDGCFHVSLALSSNGKTLAVGSGRPNENDLSCPSGCTLRAHQCDEETGQWWSGGQDLEQNSGLDWFGWSVALSGDGSIVAAGGDVKNGHIKVFTSEGL